MASVTFKRGTRAEIEATAKQDGQILMETDQTNNKMYVDLQNNNRVRIGNSNVDDISGITDSLTATSSNIALSAAGGNNLQGQIDTLNSSLENMFTSFDVPIAGTRIEQHYANIITNIDKTKYKPISLQYNGPWDQNCFFTINSDDVHVNISIGCIYESYTIPSKYVPLKLICVNINN